MRGWVRNAWDGSVEALFEGPEARSIGWWVVPHGPRMAQIDSVEVREPAEAAGSGDFPGPLMAEQPARRLPPTQRP